MTPPHGIKQSGDEEAAHMHRCESEEGGPVYGLKQEVKALQSGFVDMTATIRTWGRAIAGAVSLLTLAVALLGYLSMREKDRAPHIVPQAQAATKGSP